MAKPAAPGSQWLTAVSSYYSERHKLTFASVLTLKGGEKEAPKIKPALRGCLTVSVSSLRRPASICQRVKTTCDSLVAQFSTETHFPFSPARRHLHSCVTVFQLLVTLADPGGVQSATLTLADCAAVQRSAVLICRPGWAIAALYHSQQETGREQPAARS